MLHYSLKSWKYEEVFPSEGQEQLRCIYCTSLQFGENAHAKTHMHKRAGRLSSGVCALLYLTLRHTIHHSVDHCTLSPKAHNKTDIGEETKQEAEKDGGWERPWRVYLCAHMMVERKSCSFVWNDEFCSPPFLILSLEHAASHVAACISMSARKWKSI